VTVVERVTLEDGRVVDREVRDDARRDVLVGRVVSLSPPRVEIAGRTAPVPVFARAVGVVPVLNDFVLVARVAGPSGERAVVLAVVEVL
jgi:hypothetical protein